MNLKKENKIWKNYSAREIYVGEDALTCLKTLKNQKLIIAIQVEDPKKKRVLDNRSIPSKQV